MKCYFCNFTDFPYHVVVMFREEQIQHNEMSLIINEDVSIRLIRFIRVQRKAEVFFLFVRGLLSISVE